MSDTKRYSCILCEFRGTQDKFKTHQLPVECLPDGDISGKVYICDHCCVEHGSVNEVKRQALKAWQQDPAFRRR